MKVDGSFQGINPSDKSSVKRKSTAKRIVKAAVVAGVVVGGVALYKNRKTPAVQKIADILNNDILAPLKQKGIPFKEKVSNIGNNLKQTVSSFTSKKNNYADTFEPARPALPMKPAAQASSAESMVQTEVLAPAKPSAPVLGLPEKSSATREKEINEALKNALYAHNEKLNTVDIPVSANPAAVQREVLALPAPKDVLALPDKSSAAGNAVHIPHAVNQPVVPDVIELPDKGAQVAADAANLTERNNPAKAFLAAAGAGAFITGGVKAAAESAKEPEETFKNQDVSSDHSVSLEDPEEEKEPVQEPSFKGEGEALQEPKDIKKKDSGSVASDKKAQDKVKNIIQNGKEFEGIFVDGLAYDGEAELLTGSLTVGFESGKAAVLKYKDGVLQKSVIFENASDKTPKTIKEYKNGRIHQKFEDISLQDGKYIANTKTNYRTNSMVQNIETKENGITKVKYFKNNTDEAGNIKGAPLPVMSTSVKHLPNGTEKRKFFAHVDGKRRHVRTSFARVDGIKDIELYGNNKKPVATIVLNEDRQIQWYMAPKQNDGYLYIKDGKLNDATTSMQVNFPEVLMEYIAFQYTKTTEDESGGTTSYYKSDDDMTLVVEKYPNGYVKKVETFNKKDGEDVLMTSKAYAKHEKVEWLYTETNRGIGKGKLVQGETTVNDKPLEKLDSPDNKTEIFKKRNDEIIKVEKDDKGFITSIATYANENVEHPECITTFDHGTPLQDKFYDEDGKLIFSSKYSVSPVPKDQIKTDANEAPRVMPTKENTPRLIGYSRFNDTYNEKTFFEGIWNDKYYEHKPVKKIFRDAEDARYITLSDPYAELGGSYAILLDQDDKIQRLTVNTATSSDFEVFFDENGQPDMDDIKYLSHKGIIKHVSPFKKNIARYQIKDDAVIEFAKDEQGKITSLAYYTDATKDTPVWRTFIKDGAPTMDALYDDEDGSMIHSSNYDEDLQDVENPLEDVYIKSPRKPLKFPFGKQ